MNLVNCCVTVLELALQSSHIAFSSYFLSKMEVLTLKGHVSQRRLVLLEMFLFAKQFGLMMLAISQCVSVHLKRISVDRTKFDCSLLSVVYYSTLNALTH